jgi:copper homeostasis protein (lipoprotein)
MGRVRWLLLAATVLVVACAGTRDDTATDREMRGLYSYLADAALFEDCETGRRYPVAFEGDHAALERAYLATRSEPGQPVFVVLRGRIEPRPPMEGDGEVPTLVVTGSGRFYPGETCGNPGATAELQDMYWKLVRLDGDPVVRLPDRREPHLVLHTADRRLAGSTGCNRLMGTYELDGDRLAFGPIATTKMACPGDGGQEARLLAALEAVTTWRIEGIHLELLDADGTVRARLEATPLT